MVVPWDSRCLVHITWERRVILTRIEQAVLDGEIVCVDDSGRPQFRNLLFHRGNPPCFFAFDLLICDGKDLRTERLMDHLDGSGAGNPNSGYAILGYPIREHFTLTA